MSRIFAYSFAGAFFSAALFAIPALAATTSTLSLPLDHALDRVTKKPFGIFITPKTSPVQPEKFRGYHTGTDFETTSEEATSTVSVHAICTGTLLQKRTVSGYGGVAIQSCTINNQRVTVLYGHLKLTSIAMHTGTKLNAGQIFAALGKGYSKETDGERKHLHLGIHKGTTINVAGYVQNKSSLKNWIDPMSVLK